MEAEAQEDLHSAGGIWRTDIWFHLVSPTSAERGNDSEKEAEIIIK